MLSGVGDAAQLQPLGIPVVQNLPGVGKNLQDHFLTFVIHEAKQPIPPPRYNILEAHLFGKTDSRLIGPDHQPLFMNVAPPLPYLDIPANAYALAPGIIRPVSRGEARLTSLDPDAPMHIDPGYLREEKDVNALVHSLEVSREILNHAAFAEWRKGEVWPRETDKASLRRYVREVSETYHHHAGTCRMGVDAGCVVDPELRVYGIAGLRVADASIMPDVVSGNTNAPSVMIGEKAADMILAAANGGASSRLGAAPDRNTLDPIEIASRDEISALQTQRLATTLYRVYDNVPAMRAKFDAHGVHPADFRELADLAKFPFTTKADLRANYPFGLFATPRTRSPASTLPQARRASRPWSATPTAISICGATSGAQHPRRRRKTPA